MPGLVLHKLLLLLDPAARQLVPGHTATGSSLVPPHGSSSLVAHLAPTEKSPASAYTWKNGRSSHVRTCAA